jgi:hypothetical protein
MKHRKFTTIALAFALSLSSTFALANMLRHKPNVRTYYLHRVYRWSDHLLCTRPTAIQTVQPACPRVDTCGMEGAPPSGAAASSVLALGLKGTIRREMHLAFCPSRQVINVVTIFSALRAHHKPMFGVEIARASQELIAHERRLLADYEHPTERVRLPPDKKTRLAIEGEAWRRLVSSNATAYAAAWRR